MQTPRPLSPNENFTILKLASGEVLLAIKLNETSEELTVEFPFIVKNYPRLLRDGRISESVTAGPFCSFAENRVFTFKKSHLLFAKKMHSIAIPFYMSLYEEHERELIYFNETLRKSELPSNSPTLLDTDSQEEEDWNDEIASEMEERLRATLNKLKRTKNDKLH